MNRLTRRVFLGVGAATVAVAAERWIRPRLENSQGRDRVINLYSARHYGSDTAIYDSFTRKTGIKVNLVEADADKLLERIKSEGANSPADVIITVDGGRLFRAQEAGILQSVNSPVLNAAVPSHLRDPDGLWFTLAKRARVILYNREKVRPSDLSTYEDLATGKWQGRLIARSSAHVYNQSLAGAILAAHDEKQTEAWARGVVANFARPPEGNDTAQIRAIAAGVADVTLANTYYLPRLAKSDKPEDQAVAAKIGVFFPNQAASDRGVHVNISGGAVLKTAPNREAAIQFLEHLVSREAQEIFAKSNNEYPVLAGVATDPVLASYGDLAQLKEDPLNPGTFGKNNRLALQIMDRAGWK